MIAQRLEAQVILKRGILKRTQDFNVNKTNSYRKKNGKGNFRHLLQ